MGWTSLYKREGQSMKDFFKQEFHSQEILDVASLLGATYMAVKYAEGHVGAVVVLTRHTPKDYYNFSYKDMDEGMGPYETNCPERILKLLTPTTEKYAVQWREQCYKNLERRNNAAKIGDTIQFADSLTFTDGHTSGAFRVMQFDNKTFFQSVNNGKFYRITNWKQKNYTIVS